MKAIDLKEYAKSHAELKSALEEWGEPKSVDESKKLYTLRG
jgi:ribulose 1,5-bisphosphate carboxylase large subunit-like protein